MTERLGEANATLARTLAGGSSDGLVAASTTTAPLLSAAAAAQVAAALPPNLRVLVPAMSSGAERARRQSVFRTNVRRAAQLNAAALRKAQAAGTPAGDAPVFGLTDFAHLTPAEFRKLYLSQPFAQLKRQVDETEASASVSAADEQPGSSDEATGQRRRRRGRSLAQSGSGLQCNKRLKSSPFSRVTVPATWDWRKVGGTSYVTPIRDQRSCGSCAAFSTMVTLEAVAIGRTLAARSGKLNAGTTASDATNLSEQDFLDCWNPRTDQCNGAMPSWYYDRAVCKGVALEADVPYRARDSNVCRTDVTRDTLGLKGWFEPAATDKALKQAVTKAPASIAIMAEDTFMLYAGGVLPCGTPGNIKGVNHAVAVIGWDASSFLVKNSWGRGWGDNGYFRLASGCAKGKSSMNMLTPGYNVGVNF